MSASYKIGDLVHIPQAVEMIDCDVATNQLVIPLKIIETKEPKIGVVMQVFRDGYVQVYCEGDRWSVKNNNIYRVSEFR